MCSQEWYRSLDEPLGYEDRALLASRIPETGFWGKYEEHWGDVQAPAS